LDFSNRILLDDGVLQNECSRLSIDVKRRFGSRKFPISSNLIAPIYNSLGFSEGFLHFIEKGAWWFHFVGFYSL
jgi:hypothetical protein